MTIGTTKQILFTIKKENFKAMPSVGPSVSAKGKKKQKQKLCLSISMQLYQLSLHIQV